MMREIIPFSYHIDALTFVEPLGNWLCQQATVPSWLLAHASDGVVWGWANQEELHASNDVADEISPPLRIETLQQLRLFNAEYEVKLWWDGYNWKAIRISDVQATGAAAIDEQQLLWGTHAEPLDEGFILLEDGAQGLRHVVPPFNGSDALNSKLGLLSDPHLSRVFLKVRHYLTEDDLGVNLITMSRLMELGVQSYGQSKK